MMGKKPSRLWAIVLAGGEGRRLEPLTRALYGTSLPKQFAVLSGRRSLLQATLQRVSALVPPERSVVVVCANHEEIARRQLTEWAATTLLVQPRNLDTLPGILLPVAAVLRRDPRARVAIFPSDHYVATPAPFLEGIGRADALARRDPSRVTLIGSVAESAEAEYGWILPGRGISGASGAARTVERFVEKPPRETARRLLEQGALWNTFASVASASAFWGLARRHVPEAATLLEDYAAISETAAAPAALRRAYARLSPSSFSRAILERARDLRVVSVAGSGWCDWGSPRRVFQSLKRTGDFEGLLERMGGSGAGVAAGSPAGLA